MENQLKNELKKLDSGTISTAEFVEKVREIAKNSDSKVLSKEEVIKEYLDNLALEKQKRHKENNLKSYKKWLSNPENKKKRSERDKARYLLNKEKAKKSK